MSDNNPIYSVDDEGNEWVTISNHDYLEYVTLKNNRDKNKQEINNLKAEVNRLTSAITRIKKEKPDNAKNAGRQTDGVQFKPRNLEILTEQEKSALRFVSEFVNAGGPVCPIKYEILYNIKLNEENGITIRSLMRTRLRALSEEQISRHLAELRPFGVAYRRDATGGRPRVGWFWNKPNG